jgi:ferric-dicitrate binding protein FerR (iron transport regulator)
MKKIGLALFIGLVSGAALNAQLRVIFETAKLAVRSGVVEVQRGNTWLPISAGERLTPGERIRTAKGSSAALEIGLGKMITLNDLSQVLIIESNGRPIVELESGSMKVFAATDIQVAAKNTMLETADQPLDLELGYQADRLNLTVFNGAVRNGPVIIRGENEDSRTRTNGPYGPDASQRHGAVTANPTYYVYPYFLYGNHDPNAGAIVPPVVNNPTNPGYRPTQIVPPMSDPIRVPVTKP